MTLIHSAGTNTAEQRITKNNLIGCAFQDFEGTQLPRTLKKAEDAKSACSLLKSTPRP